MADVVIASQPRAAIGPNGDRRVAPLMLPASVRSVPEVPQQVTVLARQLQMNQQRFAELDAYYRGEHAQSFDSLRFQRAFGRQLRKFADNWVRLVVKATVDRLHVQGFRVGESDEEGVSDVDAIAWRFWTANHMPQASKMAHRSAMKFGTSFVMVDPLTGPNDPPLITVESPYQVIGQRDPLDRYSMVSAIKKWVGADGAQYLNFFTPDIVMKFRAAAATQSAVPNDPGRVLQSPTWIQYDEQVNPLGMVPIVAIENDPDEELGGESDLDDLIPLNDALNKTIRDALVASEYQGFRQRWVTGVEIPKDPQTGKPLSQQQAQLAASEANAWMFSSKEAKVGEFGQVDLSGYVSMMQEMIHHISMVSQTPAYMLVGKMANLSADAIRAAELGFVGKLWTKQDNFGGGWNRALWLALVSKGVVSPQDPVETIWRDAAANSGSILANELSIMAKLGVPQTALLEKYGYSPQTISRWQRSGELMPMDPVAASQISPGPMDKGAPDD